MIASLPMYERAETRAAHDRFWDAIRAEFGEGAPNSLSRTDDPWAHWQDPTLLLSQTCSLPFRTRLSHRLTLVGTPDYGVEGCAPGHYRSIVLRRRGTERQRSGRLAYNEPLSQSGWAAAADWARQNGFEFIGAIRTGGHRASARALVENRADIAFLDAVTWRAMRRWDREITLVNAIDATDPTPGLPLVTAQQDQAGRLRRAVRAAIGRLSAADREQLFLRDLVEIPLDCYIDLPLPPEPPESRA